MQRPTINLIIAHNLFASAIFECKPVVPNTPSAHIATFNLTAIVDKSSWQPIDDNIITLRWETSDGKPIKIEQYTGKSSLSTTILADGRVRLFAVDVLGYIICFNAFKMKLEADKPLHIMVEMECENKIQGDFTAVKISTAPVRVIRGGASTWPFRRNRRTRKFWSPPD